MPRDALQPRINSRCQVSRYKSCSSSNTLSLKMRFLIECMLVIVFVLEVASQTHNPTSPIVYAFGQHIYRGSSLLFPNSMPSYLDVPVMMNFNSSNEGWNLENISFISSQCCSSSMVVNNTQLYTFGVLALSGVGVDSWNVTEPTLVKDFSPERIISLHSALTFTTALLSNGSTYTWGSGDMGKYVGSGYSPIIMGQPGGPVDSFTVEPTGNHKAFTAVWSDPKFASYALDVDQVMWHWGVNQYAGLDPTAIFSLASVTPSMVSPTISGLKFVSIVGLSQILALIDDGTWLCWGRRNGENRCGANQFLDLGKAAPRRIINPIPNIKFVKLAMIEDSSNFALANDSTLWAWGPGPIPGAPTSPYCNSTGCFVHKVQLPQGRENVKILDIIHAYSGTSKRLFILNEYSEIYGWDLSNWVRVPLDLPNGHMIDFSNSQHIGYGPSLWITKLVPPCLGSRATVGGVLASCIGNNWTIVDDASLDSNLTDSGSVQFLANLIVSAPSTLFFENNQNRSIPMISVDGCIEQMDLLSIQLSVSQLELEQGLIEPRVLLEFSANCANVVDLNTTVLQPDSKVKAEAHVELVQVGNRMQMIAVVSTHTEIGQDFKVEGEAPTIIYGDLILTAPTIMTVGENSFKNGPALIVEGCVKGIEFLNVDVEITKTELNSASISPRIVLEFNSSCSIAILPPATVSQPKLCKKAQAEVVEAKTEARSQLSVVFKISKVSCNTWWIILISVIGGVVVLAALGTALLFLVPSLRIKCQPYVRTRE